MIREDLIYLYKKYNLSERDVFKHSHYTIISRSGIEKIQAKENIYIEYTPITMESQFACVKARAYKRDEPAVIIETFGSALYGQKQKVPKDNGTFKWEDTGTCTTLYVAEMSEKRAMSRAVLKITGLYAEGVFGEDEAESFSKSKS